MAEAEPSYIDYEAFLDPDFSATSFANTLVTTTNNPTDTPLDLSTPLSRVLFDIQEVDTHIHNLSTKSAIPLLSHTKEQSDASQRIIDEVETQVASLTDNYQRLEKEVIQRYETADEVRTAVSRLWQTVKIGRAISRCLLLSRQLEAQMAEIASISTNSRKDNHKAMIRASNTLLALRQIFSTSGPSEEGEHLSHINLLSQLQSWLFTPTETNLRTFAEQIIREFSLSSLTTNTSAPQTYSQTEETKSRTTSAFLTLYLLSPPSASNPQQPALLLSALQSYLRTALTSSLASLTRALATLPTLDRTLLEVSARCQNIVALESLLKTVKPPPHSNAFQSTRSPLPLSSISPPANLLQPLLASLDTSSLPSYFWRTLAEGLSGRVNDLMAKGGVSARTLKSQRTKVREGIRECVLRGSSGFDNGMEGGGGWEREAAVMVGAVVGGLGR